MKKTKRRTPAATGSPKSALELVDLYFLDMRSALLETAAALDRVERAGNSRAAFDDPRIVKILQAAELLHTARHNRAEQFQLLFSER